MLGQHAHSEEPARIKTHRFRRFHRKHISAQFPLLRTAKLETCRSCSEHRNAVSPTVCLCAKSLQQKSSNCFASQQRGQRLQSAAKLRLHTAWHGPCSSHCCQMAAAPSHRSWSFTIRRMSINVLCNMHSFGKCEQDFLMCI